MRELKEKYYNNRNVTARREVIAKNSSFPTNFLSSLYLINKKRVIFMKHEKVVKELVQKLKERFGGRIESIVVFGSYARGESKEESDIDVLIVGDVKLDEIYPILLRYGVYISPIVMSRDYFEMLKAERAGFIENVLKEGIALYDRA